MNGTSKPRDIKALQRIRLVSHLLDNAMPIPGTTFRVGIDPVLGLLPGAGDWLSTLMSVYIVLESLRFRLPKKILLQMLSNLLLDTVAGSVPMVGDVFDVTWKANHRNLKLLETHLQSPQTQKPANRLFVGLIILALVALVVVVTLIAVTLVSLLVQVVQGGFSL